MVQLSWKMLLVIVLLLCFLLVFILFYQNGTATGITNSMPDLMLLQYLKRFNTAQDIPRKREPFIPTDEKLKQMTLKDMLNLTHSYQDHIEVLCRDQKRIGSVFDGGKHVCIDAYIRPSKPCLVYSFGSQNEFSFERDVLKWFGCELHTFDPTVKKPSPPKGCTFHSIGLGGEAKDTELGKMSTLDKIMKSLNHTERMIDILKMDIDTWEWKSLPQMVENNLLRNTVKQIAIELHFHSKNETLIRSSLSALRGLSDAGFLVFSRERNTFCPACTHFSKLLNLDISFVTEFSLLNERFLP